MTQVYTEYFRCRPICLESVLTRQERNSQLVDIECSKNAVW